MGELCSGVEKETGLSRNQQTVMFRGKILKLSDNLVDNGVAAGDVLNVIKSRVEKVACKRELNLFSAVFKMPFACNQRHQK